MKTKQKKNENAFMGTLFYSVAQNVKDILSNSEVACLNKKFSRIPYLSFSKSYLNTGRSERENYYIKFFEILAKDTPESIRLRKSVLRLCVLADYNAIDMLMDMWGEEMLSFKNKRRNRFFTTGRMALVMMILNTMTFYLMNQLTWQSGLISNVAILFGAIATHVCFEPDDTTNTFLGFVAEAMDDDDEKEFDNEMERMVHLENTIFDTLEWAALFSHIRDIPPAVLSRNGGSKNTSIQKFTDIFLNGFGQAEAEILSIFPFLLVNHDGPTKPLEETNDKSEFNLGSRLCEYLHKFANYPDSDGHIQTFMETFDECMKQKELDKRLDEIKKAMEMEASAKKAREEAEEKETVDFCDLGEEDEKYIPTRLDEGEGLSFDEPIEPGHVSKN